MADSFVRRSVAHRAALRRSLAAAFMITLAGLLAACGESSHVFPTGALTPTLTSISVTPATATVARGAQQQYSAKGIYSDGSTQNLTTAVGWSSSAPSIVTINNAGNATAAGAGTATITAALSGFSATARLTVTSTVATVTSIAITPANSVIAKGASQALVATATYSDGTTQNVTAQATWTSSSPAILSLSATGGVETGFGASPGTVTITASLAGVSATTGLTVTPATLASIAVTPSPGSVPKGRQMPFTATGRYSDGSMQNITTQVLWTSSAPNVASVTNAGVATGLAVGSTTIAAALGNVVGSAMLNVTAAVLVSIAITPAAPVINVNGTQAFIATGTYSDGSTQVITTTVTWTSATGTVAAISNAAPNQGIATGVAVGTTQITATDAATGITSPPVTLTVRNGFAYVVNFNSGNPNGSVSQFTINAAGSLVSLTPATVAARANPYALAVDNSSRYLYVANYTQPGANTPGTISQYTIQADGTLTPMSTPSVATLDGPSSITVNPQGPYLYVANYDSSVISQYLIGAGGALTTLAAPVSAGVGLNPTSTAVNPAGTYVYALDYNTNGRIFQYLVNPDGSLAPMATPSVAAGNQSSGIVVDPSGRYVYIANSNDNTVGEYTIGVNGALTPMSVPTVAAGTRPWSISFLAQGANLYAYVPNRTSGTVSQYTVGVGGALVLSNTVAAGTDPTTLAFDASGRFAYVTDRNSGTNTITQFAVGANGVLSPLAPPTVTAGTQPAAVITVR